MSKIVVKSAVKRKPGYMYFVDGNGNIGEAKMRKGGTKGAKRKSCAPKKKAAKKVAKKTLRKSVKSVAKKVARKATPKKSVRKSVNRKLSAAKSAAKRTAAKKRK